MREDACGFLHNVHMHTADSTTRNNDFFTPTVGVLFFYRNQPFEERGACVGVINMTLLFQKCHSKLHITISEL